MHIENKITDSIIMFCVFKGLCCVIVKLIVRLSPLGQSPSNISSKVRTNLGRQSRHGRPCHHVGVTTGLIK